MIENIYNENILLSIIIRNDFTKEGIEFFTPNEFSQQVASMNHKQGHLIEPHFHNKVVREVNYTQEVLIIRNGKLRVDFYDSKCNYLKSKILNAGDIIILVTGGHGFEVLEDLEMIEIKQGPYVGEEDKTRFTAVNKGNVIIK
ncbi:hypothetical protein [Clostridium saccharoperbutylacetonicum]|uniref:hypothetical protein n=1 Tax=Clostridium saccharoperbutylacetonicum TaxID=36745 RepID=UPI00098403D3|nr:hypothetical protein [Clostridium saccharoperbutylacetonicum]AQR97002.1 hypothetical protein CLSAP_43260 [Clostridium saccharoperbutylacetonicum]NSB32881.1 mannose-6-phosphate isomerase-like protein (cupin superfamily) [Clostridium saccharoperbutylacetonicum]